MVNKNQAKMERNERLENIIEAFLENKNALEKVLLGDFVWLCSEARDLFLSEPSLLEIQPPVNICGDIHGQFHDLLRVFDSGGFVPDTKILFLGDYVDRGDNSVEVIGLLLALKLRYPSNIYLIRGNHESPEMTDCFGFWSECCNKLCEDIVDKFMDTFDALPLAAIVGNQIFCVHGGLSPSLQTLDDVRAIERPTQVPQDGIVADLLWSDPLSMETEWGPNDRGATITWGLKAADRFLTENGLKMIVRGHQLAANGFNFPFEPDRRVVTIFSASFYAKQYDNSAAFMKVSEDCSVEYIILPIEIPVVKLSRSSSNETPAPNFDFPEEKEEKELVNVIPGTPRGKKLR